MIPQDKKTWEQYFLKEMHEKFNAVLDEITDVADGKKPLAIDKNKVFMDAANILFEYEDYLEMNENLSDYF